MWLVTDVHIEQTADFENLFSVMENEFSAQSRGLGHEVLLRNLFFSFHRVTSAMTASALLERGVRLR